MAKAMREALAARGAEIGHGEALDIVSKQFGFDNWNILSARIDGQGRAAFAFDPATPIFRIFDEAKARDFYCGWLSMTVDWEHRFHPNAPLYMQVARGALKLHLSEHSGDASPGSTALVYMKGVEAWQKELIAKPYKYNRPGLEKQDWGWECTVIDPFRNQIRFLEPKGGA